MSSGPQGTISAVFFAGNSKMKSRHTEKACIMIKKRLKLEADGNFYHREQYLVARKPPSSLGSSYACSCGRESAVGDTILAI